MKAESQESIGLSNQTSRIHSRLLTYLGITRYHISMNTSKAPELALFPLTAEVNDRGHLLIGGCDVVDLTKEFGTPLYLFDEPTLRHKCREFKDEFCKYHPDTLVIYASKAFLNRALALIFKEEGLGLDVVSGGGT